MINISKPIIKTEEINAVVAVLKSGMLAQGPRVKEFEEKFATYCGTKYAVALNSGTAALHAALYALGITAGSEVITTPFTFIATANAILMQNATIKFVDINESDYCIDVSKIDQSINKRTVAVLPVDLYGQIYNYSELNKLAKQRGLSIIEDACQAVGAEYKNRKAGNCGDVGTFSFYATKNIMTGEGGMITTNKSRIAQKVKLFRHHGQDELRRYEYVDLGYNYRMLDLTAALGIVQMTRIKNIIKQRQQNAALYNTGLRGLTGLILPVVSDGNTHVYHQYTIRVTKEFPGSRDDLIAYLKSCDIGTGIYYPQPLHLFQHLKKFGYKKGDFPVAEKVANEVLSLPVHPSLTTTDIHKVVESISNYYKL